MSEPTNSATKRRAYKKPRVQTWGTLAELTLAAGGTGRSDGGGTSKTMNKTGLP
jgi:hypothetical protein